MVLHFGHKDLILGNPLPDGGQLFFLGLVSLGELIAMSSSKWDLNRPQQQKDLILGTPPRRGGNPVLWLINPLMWLIN